MCHSCSLFFCCSDDSQFQTPTNENIYNKVQYVDVGPQPEILLQWSKI